MSASTPPATNKKPILLVCLAVFGLMVGQQMVTPILAPLARQLGFSELALGVVLAVGASGVVLASSFWGRRASSWGHRAVLLISLVGAMAGLAAFAVVAQVGLAGLLAVPPLFVLALLTRGLVFGLFWGATPVIAQSYVAGVTTGEAERVRGMSMVGAAQGLAFAVGPALGGLLSSIDILVPMYVAPVILAVIALVVWRVLPRPSARRERRESVKVSLFDRRMWPFLTTGFGLYLVLSVVLMTVGFLLQDRMHLSVQETGRTTGLVMLAAAGMVVIVQAAVVPRLTWPPARLMQVGTVLMTAGALVCTIAPTVALLCAGVGLIGAGMGFGLPGVMAGPTLLATQEEQGSVAGLVSASIAFTFVVGPVVGNGLYEIAPSIPYIAVTVLTALLAVFTFVHPGVRQVRAEAPAPAPRT